MYQACKMVGQPRTRHEVMGAAYVDERSFNANFKMVATVMQAILASDGSAKRRVVEGTQSSPDMFVDRFCNALNYDMKLIGAAKFLLREASALGLVSEKTAGVRAAAAIYLCAHACGLSPDLKAVADLPISSPDTVMKVVAVYYGERMRLFPAGFVDTLKLETLGKP